MIALAKLLSILDELLFNIRVRVRMGRATKQTK